MISLTSTFFGEWLS